MNVKKYHRVIKIHQLITSENKLAKQIFESCPIGKAIVDLNGNWIQVNEALCILTGYQEEELLKSTFNTITHPEDLELDIQIVASLLNKDQNFYEVERRYIKKDSTIIVVLVTASVLWEDEEPKYFIVNVQDIGKRKELEYKNELIAKDLEKLNEEKDDYLNTVSHELRSPLTNIKMAISMLKTRQEQEGIVGLEKYIDILDRECTREINLINDLLDIQKLDAGYSEPNDKEIINISSWLIGLLESFSCNAAKISKNIQREIKVIINVNSLDRIVGELLNNASKYTEDSGEIYISLKTIDNNVELSIKNTASLSNTDVENIFKKFYRISSKGKSKKLGTGLGLPLIKKVIESIGCYLNVINTKEFVEMILIIPKK